MKKWIAIALLAGLAACSSNTDKSEHRDNRAGNTTRTGTASCAGTASPRACSGRP